jgi:hypothetical protein
MLLQRQYHLLGRRNNFNGSIGGQFLTLGRVNPVGKSTGSGKQFPDSFSIISSFKKAHGLIDFKVFLSETHQMRDQLKPDNPPNGRAFPRRFFLNR